MMTGDSSCAVCSRKRKKHARWIWCWDACNGERGTCSEDCAKIHAKGHNTARDLKELERSWRAGWAEEFPGERWPGLEEAQRRLRERVVSR